MNYKLVDYMFRTLPWFVFFKHGWAALHDGAISCKSNGISESSRNRALCLSNQLAFSQLRRNPN